MPRQVRAGAYLMLADAQARNQQLEAAALNLMRVAILYPEQYNLASAALYRCADLQQTAGQNENAKSLYAEVIKDYGTTVWAAQAKAKLNNLNN